MSSNIVIGGENFNESQPRSHSLGLPQVLPASEPAPTSVPRRRGRPRVKPLIYGPSRKRGRPKKEASQEVSQKKPRKKARKHSPASQSVTITFGKFKLTEPRSQDVKKSAAPILKPQPCQKLVEPPRYIILKPLLVTQQSIPFITKLSLGQSWNDM
ncbi:hypothetical protein AGABI1DRAFT_95935 [Agaricus bisporus var. burnettii JB137-S8]|uniref:Uncharacterized protein n=1 Tax=Agaricus bisporus var. burnettii (strain JB137-S8 / ATCC MYA-4627 / FGSC 10392) TaxID=597362 RepID=K5VI29_AGABU|nr:uncharacterized protein AGABI1DRAFT_95935 [Agaricus bisporus var. burnettii JB137-S8]EKM74004.1 hypothetical protein AGABI1DRAFT_95935 [Agaricus bisporus var. burnettii JB137-S8]